MNFWTLFIINFLFMASLMTGVFFYARKIDNYSIVDGAWSLSFFLVALITFFLAPGWPARKLLMLITASLWSLRLGFYLSRRIYQHHPDEDGRYKELRSKYEPKVARGFFQFFQIQALSVVLLSVPFFLVSENSVEAFSPVEWVGAGLWLIAILGESLADSQLSRFKADPANREKVCDVGLWNYSRHPNYFFESCIWFGFFFIALGSSSGWLSFYCPLFILFLVTRVTGIPPSEAQALRTRGDAFRAYQAKTSIFVPWFHKRTSP